MRTFAYTAAYFIFLSNSDAQKLITSQVSYWNSKRLEGLGKSGSNGVITEPMSKTRLSRARTYLHTKEQPAVLSKKKEEGYCNQVY